MWNAFRDLNERAAESRGWEEIFSKPVALLFYSATEIISSVPCIHNGGNILSTIHFHSAGLKKILSVFNQFSHCPLDFNQFSHFYSDSNRISHVCQLFIRLQSDCTPCMHPRLLWVCLCVSSEFRSIEMHFAEPWITFRYIFAANFYARHVCEAHNLVQHNNEWRRRRKRKRIYIHVRLHVLQANQNEIWNGGDYELEQNGAPWRAQLVDKWLATPGEAGLTAGTPCKQLRAFEVDAIALENDGRFRPTRPMPPSASVSA